MQARARIMRFGPKDLIHLFHPKFGWGLMFLALASLAGCDGAASQEELGEVHYRLPRIDGMETRYVLPPQLKANSARPAAESPASPAQETAPSTPAPSSVPADSGDEASEGIPSPGAKVESEPEKSTAP